MTTSETPTAPQPAPSATRLLRRSRTDRVAAGVSGGLGEYFGLDPVLFRVLFATSAFFGGAGILAYLLAWAAIPEEGTARAPVDGWIAALRLRRVPVWAAAIVAGLVLWGVAFSWWAPGPFFPVVAVAVLLVAAFARRELRTRQPEPVPGPEPGVRLDKPTAETTGQPSWVADTRAWYQESRAAARERRRRSFPIRVTVLLVLVGSLLALGIADAATGIPVHWYFWTVAAVLGLGIVVAAASRRWSWTLVPLLFPAIAGSVAFAGSSASLHDGVGQREWQPVTAPAAHYRLGFGQGVLDLRRLHAGSPTHIDVTLGAGQVKVLAPRSMNMTVDVDVRFGELSVDGIRRHGGAHFTRVVDPLAGASGVPVTVDVHLANGQVSVSRH